LPLGDEAQKFIAQLCRWKRSTYLLLTKTDGTPWGQGQQAARIKAACTAADIRPKKVIITSIAATMLWKNAGN
jgi:hypothetical protein